MGTAVWVGTVASAAACMEKGESLNLDYWWVYWVSHLLAGMISGAWFVLIYGKEMDGDDELNVVSPMTPIAHLHQAGSIGKPSSKRNLYATVNTTEDQEDQDDVGHGRKGSVVDELLKT